jgi:rhodanese-related sulfurtransferase
LIGYGDRHMNVPVPSIGVHELFELLPGGALLIDVREPHEFEEVRAPGARLVPLQTVPENLKSLPKDTEFFVICKSGARSHAACEWLRAQGYPATNIRGGTLAWMDEQFPIETGSIAS